MRKIYLFVLLVMGALNIDAQSCGFTCNADQEAAANAQLTNYILASQANLGLEPYSTCSSKAAGKVKLPIVFHLIYPNGTPSGTSSNWTDAKVNSIVDQLNTLFMHESGETFTNPYSGRDIEFEFVLAKRTPNNTHTNGIDRYITNKYQTISMFTDTPMKTEINWDPNRYINVYVVHNVSGAAAYALFPSFHGGVRDGLVVSSNSGSATLMTHELGHYFGLYHTFQGGCENGNCLESGDHVCDTPPKATAGTAGGSCAVPNNSCLTDEDDDHDHNPLRATALGGIGDQPDGLENYMDYTGACYGGFTQGQKERMRATLFSIRGSLMNETVYAVSVKDVSLEEIVFPGSALCDKLSDVIVKFQNNSNQAVSNIPLTLELNGVGKKTITYAGPLAAGASAEATFENIIFNDDINSIIVYTDWSLDEEVQNNMVCSSTSYSPPLTDTDINNDFESSLGVWKVENPDNLTEIAPFNYNDCADNDHKILAYESLLSAGGGNGNHDYLVSKTIDLKDAVSASIQFDYAYKRFYSNLATHLSLEASNDCGQNYDVLSTKTGTSLNTTTFDRKYDPFYPKSCDDWDAETVDLSAYLGEEITLRFHIELEGSQGQNLFLDNINIEIERNNLPDCNNDIGGTASIDACGVCSGGLTGLEPNASCVDCNNEINGTASIDACGVCSGGSTNIEVSSACKDCNGDINGGAAIDGCGECTGGLTGIPVNSGCVDCYGVPGGSAIIDSCGVCSGGTTGLVVNATCLDCNGDPNGTASIDACGECAGGRTGLIPDASCSDCNGDLNGTAEIDLCGVCVGGNTGLVANESCTDCNGDIHGTAQIDGCGLCAGGKTNIAPGSTCTDCNGELNGSAVLDACGTCSGGTTGNVPDNSCVNSGGCAEITVTPGVFCTPNTSVTLVAKSTSGSCNNLKWYSTATGGTALATGCIFNTPNLSSEISYYVEDNVNLNTPSNTSSFKTGYDFNSTGISNFQGSSIDQNKRVRFTANETTTLKSVDVQFQDCQNFDRFTVYLRDITDGTTQTKVKSFSSCTVHSAVTLDLGFSQIAGHNYELYIGNLQVINGGNWQSGNGQYKEHQNRNNPFSSYFSGTKLTVSSLVGFQTNGTGAFYNWRYAEKCPRTEVKVFENCFDICGNGIDDDNDGEIDEGCVDFSCNGRLLQTLGNTLYSMNISPFSFDPISTFPYGLNSTAYNPTDNKIYATIDQGGAFIRIAADGSYENLGFSRKADGTPLRTWAADIGSDGTYYVMDNSENKLYTLDLTTMLATLIVDPAPGLADIAYNPQTGFLYGIDGQKHIIEIDPILGVSNDLGKIQGIPGLVSGGGVGAVYFNPSGELIAYGTFLTTNTQQDDMVVVDISTLQGRVISQDGLVTSNNDGASCPYSVSMEKTTSLSTILPGDEFEYKIEVLNASAFDVANVSFIDVLPKGLSVVEIIENDLGTLTNDIAVQDDLLEIKKFNLPKGKSELVFKVKLEEDFICEPYTLPNQAKLSNLPATLGKVVLSNDPITLEENDSTYINVDPNTPAILYPGVLSSVGDTVCEKLEETVSLTGSTGKITWQQSNDSITWLPFVGQKINDSVVVFAEENSGTTIIDRYYRAVLTSVCDTQYIGLKYSIAPKTLPPIVKNSLYCLDDSPSALSAVGSNLKWYETLPSTGLAVAPTPSTNVDGVTNYYVTQTLHSCESDPAMIDVIVTPTPDQPNIPPFLFCQNEPSADYGLSTSHLTWYESISDTTPLFDEPVIDFSLVQDTTFYVSYLVNGCESDKAPLQLTIENCDCNPTGALIGSDTLICATDSVLYQVALDSSTSLPYQVKYQFSNAFGVQIDSISNLNASGVYDLGYVKGEGTVKLLAISDENCEVEINDSAVISLRSIPEGVIYSEDSLCPSEIGNMIIDFPEGSAPFTVQLKKPSGDMVTFSALESGDSLPIIDQGGSYELVSIVDANGCSSETNPTFDFVNLFDYPDTVQLSSLGSSKCEEINDTLVVSPAIPSIMWQQSSDSLLWREFTGQILNDSSIVINHQNTSDSTQHYYHRVISTSFCAAQIVDAKYEVKPKPLPPLTDSLVYCLNESAVALQATGSNLLWYDTLTSSGMVIAPIPSTSTVDVSNYYVSQTIEGCESDKAVAQVIIEYCCDLNGYLVGADTSICAEDSVSYAVWLQGGTNLPYIVHYQFSTSLGVQYDSIRVNTNGEHTLGWFKAHGTIKLISIADGDCQLAKNDSARIESYESPLAFITSNDSLCIGETGYLHLEFLQGTAPYELSLIKPGGQTTLFNGLMSRDSLYIIDTVGSYRVSEIIDQNGCRTNFKDSINFQNIFDYPEATLQSLDRLSYCAGNSVSIEAEIVVGGQYHWYKNGLSLSNTISNQLSNVTKGVYFFELSQNGCSTISDTVKVLELPNVVPALTISADKDSICPQEQITFTLTDSSNGGSAPIFEWYSNNMSMGVGHQLATDDILNGDVVTLRMLSNNRCQTKDTAVSNSIRPFVRDTLGELALESGELAPCVNEEGLSYKVSTLPGQYSWTVIAGDPLLINTTQNTMLLDVGEQNIDLEVEVTGECNNTSLLVEIRPFGLPDLELVEDLVLCQGESDTLSIIDHTNLVTEVDWYFDNQFLKTDHQHVIDATSSAGEYFVIGSNGHCIDTSNTVQVKFIDLHLTVKAEPQIIAEGESTHLSTQSNVDSIRWSSDDFEGLPNWSTKAFDVRPLESTNFLVVGTIGNCEISDEIWVKVIKPFQVPYFFSPNDDGDNDEWIIDNLESYDNYSIYIYNRWGNLVKKYENEYSPWKGDNDKKEKLPDGTYFYIIEAEYDSKVVSITGHVTILK